MQQPQYVPMQPQYTQQQPPTQPQRVTLMSDSMRNFLLAGAILGLLSALGLIAVVSTFIPLVVNNRNDINKLEKLGGGMGTPGFNGSDGADGAPGLNGTNGSDGAPGAPGVPGMNGIDGVNGTTTIITLGVEDRCCDKCIICKLRNQTFVNEQIFEASNKDSIDEFGVDVDIDDGYAVVSSGKQNKTVFVYRKLENGLWVEEIQLTPSQLPSASYGEKIILSCDTLIVTDQSGDTNAGIVYIYTRSGIGNWTEQILHRPEGIRGSFGGAIALQKNTLVVSSLSFSSSFESSVLVFKRTGSQFEFDAILSPKSPLDDISFFGYSIAIDCNYIAVGAPMSNFNATVTSSGKIYIFFKSNDVWEELQIIQPSDAMSLSPIVVGYGSAISMYGDYLAVSNSFGTGATVFSGTVYMYKRVGAFWGDEQKLFPSGGVSVEVFGHDISLKKKTIVIAALTDNDKGRFYIFTRSDKNNPETWVENGPFTSANTQNDQEFGKSISLSNQGDIIVGAPGFDSDKGFVSFFNSLDCIFCENLIIDF